MMAGWKVARGLNSGRLRRSAGARFEPIPI
jgi:hypothetical protein